MAILSSFPEKRGLNTDDINDIASGEISNGFVQSQTCYSTEEQVIGKWIDGKPLYQRIIDCGAIPSGPQNGYIMYTFPTTTEHIHYMFGYTDVNGVLPYVNPVSNGQAGIGFTIATDIVPKDFRIYTVLDRSAFGHIYICVQYTKTTD